MAPFTQASPDRPSRFSDGSFGVLYVAETFETALFETIHHHALFMARTREPAGWTSQFREIVLDVAANLHDLRDPALSVRVMEPNDYSRSQALGTVLYRYEIRRHCLPKLQKARRRVRGPLLSRPRQATPYRRDTSTTIGMVHEG